MKKEGLRAASKLGFLITTSVAAHLQWTCSLQGDDSRAARTVRTLPSFCLALARFSSRAASCRQMARVAAEAFLVYIVHYTGKLCKQ